MLGVILKILSILGIVLLVLLAVALFVLLLVLFIPVVYKADAEKTEDNWKAKAKAGWLFGFLRVNYSYPEPGNVIVKLLWITIFDSAQKKKIEGDTKTAKNADAVATETKKSETETVETSTEQLENIAESPECENADTAENGKQSLKEKLFTKIEKIKYTIQQFYDKIKHVWDNISFYRKLLQDEETGLLFSHVCKRLGKILRHIRPRKIKANVMFGAESPDTTGYVYGIYGMFSTQLGKEVCITPDFNRKILQGTVSMSGHITVFTLLVNSLAVILDKRLHLFIRRIKKHSAKQVQGT